MPTGLTSPPPAWHTAPPPVPARVKDTNGLRSQSGSNGSGDRLQDAGVTLL